MTRTARRLGSACVLIYVAVALATAALGPGRLRPLFDGFASHPGVYNWVKPPKEFAEGNRPPESGQARVAFGANGSSPAQADTVDGQATASSPAGAVPPQGSDGAATLDVRPFDATTLGPLPDGLRAEGNAYQVGVTYLPSRAQARALTAPGTVGVLSEAPSDTLLFSADGRSWRRIEGQVVAAGKGFTAPLTELGYYLAAGPGPPRPFEASGGAPVALLAVAAIVPLVLGALLLGRRRARPPGPASTRIAPKTPGSKASRVGTPAGPKGGATKPKGPGAGAAKAKKKHR